MQQVLIYLIWLLKKDFIALKAEGCKLHINKLYNVLTRLNDLKTRIDNLDVGKLKAVPVV